MVPVELRGLRYFVTVAQVLNFGRAAKMLHITQPGLSQGIKTFERHIGCSLFERDRQRVVLTPAGEALLPAAEKLLAHANEVEKLANTLAQRTYGTLIISHTRSTGVGLPFTIMSAFRVSHPQMEIQAQSGFSSLNIRRVIAREIDLGFIRPPIEIVDELEVKIIGYDSVVLAVPADHALASAPTVTTAEFVDEPLVFFAREAGGLWDSIMQAVYGTGTSPRIVRIEPDEPHMLAAVSEGVGVSLVTESAADMLNLPGVVFKRFREPTRIPMGMTWRRDNVNPALAVFLDFVRYFLGERSTA